MDEMRLSGPALSNFLNAFAQGAKFRLLKDRIYAYSNIHDTNYFCWCVEPGSTEYSVTPTSCSCPAFRKAQVICKHIQGLQDILATPAPVRRQGKDRRRTRG